MRWLLLLLTVPALSATYYVRTDGNNANTGLANDAAHAWATPAYAAGRVAAGDTALIADGTYSGSVTLSTSGSAGNLITFRGASTNAWIQGQINWSASYVVMDRVRVGITTRTRGWPNPGDGGMPYGHIDMTGTASHNLISNCAMNSGATQGGRANPGHGTFWYAEATGVTYNTITNCDIARVNWTKGIFQIWGANNLIINNRVHTTWDCDVCYIHGTDNVIDGNEFCGNVLADAENPIESQHSDLFQSFGPTTTTGTIVRNNWAHDSECQIGYITQDGGTVDHFDFYNNTFARITSFLRLSAPYCRFYNNTIYDHQGTYPLHYGGSGNENSDYLEISNNAFVGYPASGSAIQLENAAPAHYTHVNNYYGTTSGGTKSAGSETGKIEGGNCAFVNAAAGDFRIGSGSVLKDAGTTLATVTVDRAGVARPQGTAYDIGAYEYTVAGVPNGTTNAASAVVGRLTVNGKW
jgi:hypothetical protein